MKHDRVRCDFCKIDNHRDSYSRHLKRRKHLEFISQHKVIVPRKYLINRVVNEENKVSDIDIKYQNLYSFTDKRIKIAYDITVENHHS